MKLNASMPLPLTSSQGEVGGRLENVKWRPDTKSITPSTTFKNRYDSQDFSTGQNEVPTMRLAKDMICPGHESTR